MACGSSLFVTSGTTAVAFFGCYISPIPVVRVFGVFAAFVVVADYVLTITFIMAMLVVHEAYVAPVERWIGSKVRSRNDAELDLCLPISHLKA